MTRSSVTGGSYENDRSMRVDALVADHFDFAWRVLRRLGASPADADDAVQEVFLIAVRKMESIMPGRERAFLVAVGTRVLAAQRRAHVRRREDADADLDQLVLPAEDVEEQLALRSARGVLESILDGLPLEQRLVLVLYELEQMPVGEIAELLEAPRGTVSWRLKEAHAAFSGAAARFRARERSGRLRSVQGGKKGP